MEKMTRQQKRLLSLCLKALDFPQEPCDEELAGYFAVTTPASIGSAGMVWASANLWDTSTRRLLCSVRRDPLKGKVLFKDSVAGKTFWVMPEEEDARDERVRLQSAVCK